MLSKLLLSNEATMYVVLHGQRTCRRVIIPRTKGVSMSHVVEHWGVALTLTTILFSTGEETGSFQVKGLTFLLRKKPQPRKNEFLL